jgi:ribosomal protein S3
MSHKVHPYSFRFSITKKYLSNWYSQYKNYSNNIHEDYVIRTKCEEFFREYILISKITIFKNNSSISKKNDITTGIYCLKPKIKDILKNINTNNQLFSIYEYYKERVLEKIETKIQTLQKLQKRSKLEKKQLKKVYLPFRKYNKFFIILFLKYISDQFIKIFQILIPKKLKIKFFFIKSLYKNINLIAKYIGSQLKKQDLSCTRLLYDIIKQYKKHVMNTNDGIKIIISGRHNGAEKARTVKIIEGKISLHVLKLNIDYAQYFQNTINGIFGIKIWTLINN